MNDSFAPHPDRRTETDQRGAHRRARGERPANGREVTPPEGLGVLLEEAFGFETFRPFQETVCRAATRGEDLLLVMPTGAGKSLCYQLPGIARGGTTLVVSPLIALMEDQVAKLQSGGFRAERIHSGRDRADSRRVCIDYLAGRLDFLFIAPERLGVPGFPEMLARHKPGLIAVDEAHCISLWGHDFRPEYRRLGERLPQLRPAPVIALTATATPRVQEDIVAQLGMPAARRFIHGFRRTNIAIECPAVKPSARSELALRILSDPAARPAIVYAPTRRQAEQLAGELGQRHPATVYHAGIPAAQREQAQTAFLAGELEIVVATIAFGMGIDKPDVRTVVHTAMPGSLESYYQEIGRAGRDGLPSRAILLHGFVDRRTHEFFLDRDYPETLVLRRIFVALNDAGQPRARLQATLRMDDEELERALEKLWTHGGARIAYDETVARGTDDWEGPYELQRQHKLGQLALMGRFADSRECRMLHLVRHFGDQEDSGERCGQCDLCAPADCTATRYRTPTSRELVTMQRVLTTLARIGGSSSTGRLHREEFGEKLERAVFERVLGALAREGLVEERPDSFEREGRVIEYRRLFLTPSGRRARDAELAVAQVIEEPAARPSRRAGARPPAARRGKRAPDLPAGDVPAELVEALRTWRAAEARRRGQPAFTILSNRAIVGIASGRPASEAELLAVHGLGPTLVGRHGAEILALVRSYLSR